jgi:hypothetical protein
MKIYLKKHKYRAKFGSSVLFFSLGKGKLIILNRDSYQLLLGGGLCRYPILARSKLRNLCHHLKWSSPLTPSVQIYRNIISFCITFHSDQFDASMFHYFSESRSLSPHLLTEYQFLVWTNRCIPGIAPYFCGKNGIPYSDPSSSFSRECS